MTELLWNDNRLQFTRLLSEIHAMGLHRSQTFYLCREMELNEPELESLFARAESEFEKWKHNTGVNSGVKDNK